MTLKAKAAARFRKDGGVFIDHTTIVEDDFEWLAEIERLTLWNVKVPSDFLSRCNRLWWVDWRGGGKGQHIEQLTACHGLRYVSLNQIRGIDDLGFLARIVSLELLSIYGMSAVQCLPSFGDLVSLRRLEIGQMKRLTCVRPALDAPNLEELYFIKKLNVTSEDVHAIKSHPALRAFEWNHEDVPDRVWEPVREAIELPPTRSMHPEDWFSL
jgi:hypothetical protein